MTFAPPLDIIHIGLPRVVAPVVDSIRAKHLVAVIHYPVALEITPEELIDEDLRALIPFVFLLEVFRCVIDLSD